MSLKSWIFSGDLRKSIVARSISCDAEDCAKYFASWAILEAEEDLLPIREILKLIPGGE